MINVENLTKRFTLSRQQKREMEKGFSGSSIDAVSNVSFSCQTGRILALLGPNGAGKTTALRVIATMLRPTSGTVSVCGFDTVKQPEDVRRRIGFLTGNTGLYHRLTVNEFVKYFADLHGMDKKKFLQRREELFSLLDIHDFSRKRIGKLSSGMTQKVSIVRTIIHDPDVLIFDEPTVELDIITSRNVMKLIRQCREEKKTVIFSTHRMDEVRMLSDDLTIIHKGYLKYYGAYNNFTEQMQTDTF